MLTCIARSKQPSADASSADHPPPEKPNSNATPTKQAIKILSSQIKDMALKASGAYRQCAPCATHPAAQQRRSGGYGGGESDSDKDRFRWSYRRAGSLGSNSSSSAGRRQLEARLKGISSGEGTPASASGRRVDPVVFVEESEPKEWVAQVEPGVLITFLSLPRGGNDLKQIKFSREMFNKWQAQKWWTENCEKVTELYNVQGLNRQAIPRSEDESTVELDRAAPQKASSSESLEQQMMMVMMMQVQSQSRTISDSGTMSGTSKTETTLSSMRTSPSQDTDISVSNATCMESEWVEQDQPGVYITIRALPHGRRELRRVRFSREKFGEMHAKVWWEENRARIHKQYL